MRVLIAEDDPISRRLLQSTLTKWGYEVEIVKNGEEALAVLQGDDPPKLAILDWMMPLVDGVEVCRELRKRKEEPYIYAILLTAKSQKDDLLAGLEAGADDYMVKPFDPHELRVRLRTGKRILGLQSELISARESIRVQAVRDPLTGLPNRLLFVDRLTEKLLSSKRDGTKIAVMFLDLDHFKYINDTLGHNAGDQLLKDVSARLKDTCREMDTIARMGGDEFTIIINDAESYEIPESIAKRIIQALSEPFHIAGHELFVTSSIGVSIFPEDGKDVETLVMNADSAMYHAKEHGRNAYHFYTESLNSAGYERLHLESALRHCIEKNELVLHYQPRMDMKTGFITGVEALVRWNNPEVGILYPLQFIGLAEETGLIESISLWILTQACSQNKAWQDAGHSCIEISVNISPRLLQRTDLTGMVTQVLNDTGLEAKYLNLEVTENTLMQNPENAVQILDAVREMGVKISIDDFGTGYSSLSCLRRLPIDFLKIDRSFVNQITVEPDAAAIASTIVAMAHTLKLKVTAEGVETSEQVEFLRSIECDEIQGFIISKPLPNTEIPRLLENNATRIPDQIPRVA